jgi:hypothetical protein
MFSHYIYDGAIATAGGSSSAAGVGPGSAAASPSSAGDMFAAAATALEPAATTQRTFRTSHFKREYEKSGLVPITKAAQIIGKIPEFVHMYCHVHGLSSEAQKVAAEHFAEQLSEQTGQHAHGGGGELMAPVQVRRVS